MRVKSTEKLVVYLCLSVIVLVSWNVATFDVCRECTCTAVGSKRFGIECKGQGLTQVPRELPLNTSSL